MDKQEQINSIERDIKDARVAKDLGSALVRLTNSRDFRAVITQGYFKDEAVRLVHLKGDPNMQTPEKQASILTQIDAIAVLNQYFLVIQLAAGMADKAIEGGEAVLDELRTEEAE
jgi:hypothetical protein